MIYDRELQNTEDGTPKPDFVVTEDFPEEVPSTLGPKEWVGIH